MCKIDAGLRSSLEMHKQEAFQGMRVYHMSEIHHKQDAINVIKASLASLITIYGAILAAVISQKIGPLSGVIVSTIVFIATCISIVELAAATNSKIAKNNERYEGYRNDYIRLVKQLGLEDTDSHWSREENRKQSGFSKTQEIIGVFENIVIGVAAIGVIFTCILSFQVAGNG